MPNVEATDENRPSTSRGADEMIVCTWDAPMALAAKEAQRVREQEAREREEKEAQKVPRCAAHVGVGDSALVCRCACGCG